MTEAEWVERMAEIVRSTAFRARDHLEVRTSMPLAYGYEISSYGDTPKAKAIEYQTDLAIVELRPDGTWVPRVIVEAKVSSISTHDAITYSTKAAAHRGVHPYLRYGIMLGRRGRFPLPGRLFRHGVHFDFMISFRTYKPRPNELSAFVKLLRAEVEASRMLERIHYQSRRRDRDRYTVLHRRLYAE